MHLSQNVPWASEYVFLWIPLPVTLLALYFINLSVVRGRMTYYFSMFICPSFLCLLSFYSGVFLQGPGSRAISVPVSKALVLFATSALMPYFCTIPMCRSLVKTGSPLSQKSQGLHKPPHRRLREASVVYFNTLFCLYHWGNNCP